MEQPLQVEVPWGLQAMQMPTQKEQAALFAQLDFNGACCGGARALRDCLSCSLGLSLS